MFFLLKANNMDNLLLFKEKIFKIRNFVFGLFTYISALLAVFSIISFYMKEYTLSFDTYVGFSVLFVFLFFLFFYVFQFTVNRIEDARFRVFNTFLFPFIFTGAFIYMYLRSFDQFSFAFLLTAFIYVSLSLVELYIVRLKHFWHIAVHEISHAVVSEVSFPKSVVDITLNRKGKNYSGNTSCKFDDTSFKNIYDLYIRQIRVFLAGCAAEQLFLVDDIDQPPEGDLDLTLQIVKNIVNDGFYPDVTDWDSLSREKQRSIYLDIITPELPVVQHILKDHFDFIYPLALVLYKKRVLLGDEFRRLITEL